jgi:Domain of unknown function (DUF222)/HNH endonuclease
MHRVAEAKRALAAALDDMAALDPVELAGGESVVELHREIDRLEAVVTRATAAFAAGGEWEADGARSAPAWLAGRCRLPAPMARRRVTLGRDLRQMPATEAAWLRGDVGSAQVSALAAVRTPSTEEAFARDEADLVEQAGRLRYRDLVRVLDYWSQLADPDGSEDDAERQHESRRLHLSQSFKGAWFLDGLLDPVSGEVVSEALRRIEDELFEADWAEARARRGDDVRAADLARTPAQRRADALVEMARRAQAVPEGARLPAPLFTVLVGYETFAGRICELASGAVVSPGSLLPWLDEAWVERVVFDGPRRIRDVGVRRRLFTGASRRAVEVRDRECFHPLCDVPARRCEVDHVEPWAEGGPTVEANARLACPFHHRRRHRRR